MDPQDLTNYVQAGREEGSRRKFLGLCTVRGDSLNGEWTAGNKRKEILGQKSLQIGHAKLEMTVDRQVQMSDLKSDT